MRLPRMLLVLGTSLLSGCSTTLFQADFASGWPGSQLVGGPPGDPPGDSVLLDPRGGANTSVVNGYGLVFRTNDNDLNNRAFFYSAYFDKGSTEKRIHWRGEAVPIGDRTRRRPRGADNAVTHDSRGSGCIVETARARRNRLRAVAVGGSAGRGCRCRSCMIRSHRRGAGRNMHPARHADGARTRGRCLDGMRMRDGIESAYQGPLSRSR